MTRVRRPVVRTEPSIGGVKCGLPVSGVDWQRLAMLQNWLAGSGRQIVPGFMPDVGQLSGTAGTPTDYTFGLWLLPTYASIERRWGVLIRDGFGAELSVGSTADAAVPTGAYTTPSRAPDPVEVREELTTQSSTGAGVDVTVALYDDAYIDCLSCYELPRAELEANADERGALLTQLGTGQPITYASAERIFAAQADDELGKRVLSAWAVPYQVNGSDSTTYAFSRTSSTWQDVYAAPIPALGRKDGRADTTRTVKARALAWEAGASPDGELRLVSSSGGNGTAISVTGTTPTWTSEFTITIDAEDLTETTGMPGGSWDDVHVEAREVGAGTLYVASIVIYE